MKRIKFLGSLVLLAFFMSCSNPEANKEYFNVFVKYKTQPNKNVEAYENLKKLIEEVKKEDHFISLKMMIDADDNSNILLHEIWDDATYYRGEHMNTEHIKEFINNSQQFLAGPPQINIYKVSEIYK